MHAESPNMPVSMDDDQAGLDAQGWSFWRCACMYERLKRANDTIAHRDRAIETISGITRIQRTFFLMATRTCREGERLLPVALRPKKLCEWRG